MEYAVVKLILVLAFFATLLLAANWASQKIEEYTFRDDDKDE